MDDHIARKRSHIRNVQITRERYDEQSLRFARAEHNFQLAVEDYRAATAKQETAAEIAERARMEWELFQKLVVIAAAIDAHNIVDNAQISDNYRHSSILCDRTSTRQYRAIKSNEGFDLAHIDVDHIIPQALGGADHILNYDLMPSSENRAWGAGGGMTKCMLVGPIRCSLAILVSVKCGSFTGFSREF